MFLTLTALLAAPAFQQFTTSALPVPAQTPAVLELKPDADGKVTVKVTRNVKEKRTIGNAEREVTTTKRVQVPLAEVNDLTVFTADGKPVDRAAALKQLADGGVVVVSADGKPLDPKFQQVLKPGTLVLVSPELKAGGRYGMINDMVTIGAVGGVIQAQPLPAQVLPVPLPVVPAKD